MSDQELLSDVIVRYNECDFFNRGNECKHPLPEGDEFEQLFACLVWEVDSASGFTTYSGKRGGSEVVKNATTKFEFTDADRKQRAIYLSEDDKHAIQSAHSSHQTWAHHVTKTSLCCQA